MGHGRGWSGPRRSVLPQWNRRRPPHHRLLHRHLPSRPPHHPQSLAVHRGQRLTRTARSCERAARAPRTWTRASPAPTLRRPRFSPRPLSLQHSPLGQLGLTLLCLPASRSGLPCPFSSPPQTMPPSLPPPSPRGLIPPLLLQSCPDRPPPPPSTPPPRWASGSASPLLSPPSPPASSTSSRRKPPPAPHVTTTKTTSTSELQKNGDLKFPLKQLPTWRTISLELKKEDLQEQDQQ